MAKKPDLQPGEYGIKVCYYATKGWRYWWVGEKFSSIEDAEEYIDEYGIGFNTPNCASVFIMDWNGKDVGGFYL